jgi:RNA-directed DNA polymerase
MPEDAPGNPGAERDAPPVRQARIREVREMQAKLHRWAGEDSSRRFGDLFNLVYDPLFLAEAWSRVSGDDGKRTTGIDAATVAGIENGIAAGPARPAHGYRHPQ